MPAPEILRRLKLTGRRFFIYNVKFVCGIQKNKFENDCEGAILSRGIYSTEINILNYGIKEVTIGKLFTPVVLNNKPIAREPKVMKPLGFDRVTLPPLHATMDDCCKIAEILKPANADELLKVGFIEIISPVQLEVVAVYTVTDLEQTHPTINVVPIEPRPLSFVLG
ncbi:MAG TPA: hypothetical protein VFH08_16805 [Chitinophagaceae bacterium]|nr:hypothetical protein [Chitinophagaceae bacterium]